MNMKMKIQVLTVAWISAVTLFAAPAAKTDPVAPGFPVWEGVTDKNFLHGRELTPSDLRHKVTILIEVEPTEKTADQLLTLAGLAAMSSTSALAAGHGLTWEDLEMQRDVIAVVSVRGATAKTLSLVTEALKSGKNLPEKDRQTFARLTGLGCSFYQNLTYAGAPDTTGKRPYIHVFGPSGAEPIYHGELVAGMKAAKDAVGKGKKEIDGWETKWRPFFGNISEPKFNTSLAKTLEKGKTQKKVPLVAIEKALLNDIKSKDEEKAKESQILYDALQQTRSDLLVRIKLEVGSCPHRAYYDVKTLLKYWPASMKQLDSVMARLKQFPQADLMGNMFTKLLQWGDPDFDCKPSDAKKIIVELNKMKKSLAPLKESKDTKIQDGASLLDMRIDSILPVMESKLETK